MKFGAVKDYRHIYEFYLFVLFDEAIAYRDSEKFEVISRQTPNHSV
jgi:hypothetical protein